MVPTDSRFAETTWKGFQVIPSDIVDLLILRCDDPTGGDPGLDGCFSFLPVSHNPFSTFPIVADEKSTIENDHQGPQTPHCNGSFQGQLKVLSSPVPFSGRTRLERYLFHHYVTQVAVIMMPYEHPNNPWTTYYPAAAIQLRDGQYDALHSAMLAQAAFNLGQLGVGWDESRPTMLESALKYYGNAMRRLLSVMGSSDIEFPFVIATIMTLMMAEVYSGQPQQWRHHLRGALNLFVQHGSRGLQTSMLARRSITSLKILKVLGDTSARDIVSAEAPDEDGATTSNCAMAARGPGSVGSASPATIEFYFTIGIPRDVLDCISRITAFRNKSPQTRGPSEADHLMESVLACLRRYQQQESTSGLDGVYFTALESGEEVLHLREEAGDRQLLYRGSSIAANVRLQMHAFIRAAYIYLYRSVMDAPPRAVQNHVAGVFSAISSFFDTYSNGGGFPGNFSLWPAFVAAVEATRDEDIEAASRWMDWALSFGIGIRAGAKTVVEEVWRRRGEMAAATGLEKDLIIVDWLKVMQELDCDVLLI
ncbi:hypothetical protein FSARC_10619 [Fusarium sarcochroum]|uniref:Uncharacterized protein n=1 Tax=Fusarium sarcochroum TaxID=1208366 RepID=A0A8H4X3L1_9HYPO|nr:hypothetical protein FSARC_10619 [Fusarium sarcochroum]